MAIIKIKPLSVNEAWKGRRFRTAKYKLYQNNIAFLLPPLTLKKERLRLEIVFGYSNSFSDIDNALKPFIDCLVKRYGIDDRYIYELNVKKEIVKVGKEFIEFEFTPI